MTKKYREKEPVKEGLQVKARQLVECLIPLAFYAAISLAVMVLAMMIVFLLRLSPGAAPEELTAKYSLWILGATAVVSVVLLVWFMGKYPEYGPEERVHTTIRPCTLMVCLLLSASAALYLNMTLSVLDIAAFSVSYESTEAALYNGSVFLEVLVTGIAVPAAEELVFRGAMLNYLMRQANPGTAILFTAIIFGLYHGNLVQFVYASLMGILFAWITVRFRDLTIAILMHAEANLVILYCTESAISEVILSNSAVLVTLIVSTALVALGCIYAVHKIQ